MDPESQALAHIMLSSDSEAQKVVPKAASTYASVRKELQKNKTLGNLAVDIGKSRWTIRRMLTSTAAGARVYSIARALEAIREFERKLRAQHDDVIALDWVTELKYDEMTLMLTVPTAGRTITQSAPELVKILQITVWWKVTWLISGSDCISMLLQIPTLLKPIDKNSIPRIADGIRPHMAFPPLTDTFGNRSWCITADDKGSNTGADNACALRDLRELQMHSA